MKKTILAITILSLFFVFACQKKESQNKAETQTESNAKYVKTEIAKTGSIESYLEYTGKIMADQYNDLAPQMSVKIEKIHVSEGDFVKKGTVLISLDKNALKQLEVNHKNAEKNYQRAKSLLANQAIDQKSYDDIEALYISAKASYESNLGNFIISAPFDGYITDITQKEGENYNAMQMGSAINGLIRIVNLNTMKAIVALSDKDLAFVKKGQHVYVNSDMYPDQTYSATVKSISASANTASGLYNCEILIQNAHQELKHNQYARFKIVKEKANNAILIPTRSIIDPDIVFSVADGKAVKNIIKKGISNKEYTQVITGIKEGEVIITEGSIGIDEGTPVVDK